MPSSFALVGGPFGRGDAVLDGGGKAVLGRQPIIDGEHQQLAFMGELAADHVMGLDVADHPAAAMEEHEAWRKAVLLAQRLRRVEPRRDRAVRRWDRDVFGGFKRGRLGIADEARLIVELARFRRVSVS